jgi:hypothetical protein
LIIAYERIKAGVRLRKPRLSQVIRELQLPIFLTGRAHERINDQLQLLLRASDNATTECFIQNPAGHTQENEQN